jgi:hypothetical protein
MIGAALSAFRAFLSIPTSVFDTNELLKLYGALRVIRYEDTDGVGDFGLQPMRIVRLLAQKP